MNCIKYEFGRIPSVTQLTELYQNVGWSSYTEEPEKLKKAVENSSTVLTAWNEKQLVGLIRCISDKETIVYVQDLLVHTSFQRLGIGKSLMNQLLNVYPHVRQKVLLADKTQETESFYKNIGFTQCEQIGICSYLML